VIGGAFDHAVAALIEDTKFRGLSAESLMGATGEMGRTPRLHQNGGCDQRACRLPLILYRAAPLAEKSSAVRRATAANRIRTAAQHPTGFLPSSAPRSTSESSGSSQPSVPSPAWASWPPSPASSDRQDLDRVLLLVYFFSRVVRLIPPAEVVGFAQNPRFPYAAPVGVKWEIGPGLLGIGGFVRLAGVRRRRRIHFGHDCR
jgi:hypothetical protein